MRRVFLMLTPRGDVLVEVRRAVSPATGLSVYRTNDYSTINRSLPTVRFIHRLEEEPSGANVKYLMTCQWQRQRHWLQAARSSDELSHTFLSLLRADLRGDKGNFVTIIKPMVPPMVPAL